MLDKVTIIYLAFTFIALYFFFLFIILTLKNRKELFLYPPPKTDFKISILIPAFNEQDSIADTIKHVANLHYPKENLEIIAINDGSTDKTLEIIKKLSKKYKNVTFIDKKNSGKADSLNQGIKKAKGELIAVVDSDSFPSPPSLKKMTGYFRDPQMGAVTSFVTVRNKDSNLFAKVQSIEYVIMGWSRKLLDFIDSVYVTNGPLSLYRKSFVKKLGGFDTETVTEDIDITWNMLKHDYKTGMCLDTTVTTVVPNKFKPWFRQRSRWGLGGLQALSKYRKIYFRKGMFGAFILPFVSFSIILSLATFFFSVYLLAKFIYTRILSIVFSVATSAPLFQFTEINLNPSIIIFFFIVLFTISISYSWYVMKTTKYEKKLTIKKFFNLIFYIIIYLSIYPLVWFSSIFRFIKGGKHKW